MSEVEQRFHVENELRAIVVDDQTVIEGYAAKFNERSQFMGFYEEIDKRAFDQSLAKQENIYALYNHDTDKLLGSTRNGTLELITDDIGLRFKLTPKANTSYLKDVKELIENGEIRGMSFGFISQDDDWTDDGEFLLRTLKDVSLKEITITPYPAYESSEVALRSKDKFTNELKKREDLKLRNKLILETYL